MTQTHEDAPAGSFEEHEALEEHSSTAQNLGETGVVGTERWRERLADPYPYRVMSHIDREGADRTRELQRMYVRNTDKLIGRVVEDDIDHAVFLDKSARPISWMMRELWDELASSEDGETPSMPETSFLNIDREQWRDVMGGREEGSGRIDVSRVDQSVIDSLRRIFLTNPETDQPVQEAPTVLDGKRVMIVDEVKFSGDTGEIARRLLQRAIPEADMQYEYHWMIGKNTDVYPDWEALPIWYSDKVESGRWINDRSRETSLASPSRVQREGWMFLSTPQEEVDTKSKQLREECAALARDYASGRLGRIK